VLKKEKSLTFALDKAISANLITSSEKELLISNVAILLQTSFENKLKQKMEENPEISGVVDQIYDHIKDHISNSPVIFIDTGVKGTLPLLISSIINIKSGQNTAAFFTYSLSDPNLFGAVPHFTTSRSEAKIIEDAGKFTVYGGRDNFNQPLATDSSPKNQILALMDLYRWVDLLETRPVS